MALLVALGVLGAIVGENDDGETPLAVVAEVTPSPAPVPSPTIAEPDPSPAPTPLPSPSPVPTSTPTPQPTVDPAAIAVAESAVDQLASLKIESALSTPTAYVRFDYDGDGWADADGDCQSTRHEVLQRDSSVPVTLSPDGCRVETGSWTDPWSGQTLTAADQVSIDHVVGLNSAHDAGAWEWDTSSKASFSNDLDVSALVIVSQQTNSAKGNSGPADWRPPDESAWCAYATDWVRVKARWSLAASSAEADALSEMLATCGADDTTGPRRQLVDAPTLSFATPSVAPTPTAIPPTPTPAPAATPAPPSNCHSSYPTVCIPPPPPDLNCGDISLRRFQVVGSDPHGFDRDNDGIGCES